MKKITITLFILLNTYFLFSYSQFTRYIKTNGEMDKLPTGRTIVQSGNYIIKFDQKAIDLGYKDLVLEILETESEKLSPRTILGYSKESYEYPFISGYDDVNLMTYKKFIDDKTNENIIFIDASKDKPINGYMESQQYTKNSLTVPVPKVKLHIKYK